MGGGLTTGLGPTSSGGPAGIDMATGGVDAGAGDDGDAGSESQEDNEGEPGEGDTSGA